MGIPFELARTSFAVGEVSPELVGHEDLAKSQTGLAAAENVIVLLEGGVTRRPGTGYVAALKTESQKGLLVSYRFDPATAYLLIFNGGVMRLLKNGAVVGGPFELGVSFVEADLPNMRWTYSGNAVFIACDGQRPQTLLRSGDAAWAIAGYANVGGPVEPQNLDKTKLLTASAATGSGISLIGQNMAFAAGHVGGVWRLDEADLTLIPQWAANETITIPTTDFTATAAGNVGDFTNPANAYDGNTATSATRAVPSGYLGRNWAAAQAVYRVDLKFSSVVLSYINPVAGGFITATLYGKNGAPANSTDGTVLGTLTFNTAPANQSLFSTNTVSTFTNLWLKVDTALAGTITIAEVNFIQFNAGISPVYRRYLGRVYQAITGGSTGATPPTHTADAASSGPTGVNWLYMHRDRGFVRITAVTNANLATADVLEVLPMSAVSGPTYRWWAASWDGVQGWPNRVVLANNSMLFARADRFWRTKPGSFFDFDVTDPTDPGSALSGRFISDKGSLVWTEWMAVAGGLVFGMRDGEWIVRGAGLFDPLTAQNITPWEDQHKGSCPQVLARLDGGALFIGRSRQRLHYATLDPLAQRIPEQEVSISARHILKPLAQRVSWQQDPNCLAWINCADGSLVGLSHFKEEKIAGWHRHPMTNGLVEDLAAIASADESESEQYFIVKRTINGATHRYVEKLQPFFKPVDAVNRDARGAWFVDCGKRYQGVAATVIAGLGHLEGQVVNVHADGAMHPQRTVVGGQITLERAATDVIVGLPQAWRARLLPLDMLLQTGSTAGKVKSGNHVSLRLRDSAGGYVSLNPDAGGQPEPIDETGTLSYGAPVPLHNEIWPSPGIVAGSDIDLVVEVGGSDTMPFTLLGAYPDFVVEEK